MEVAVEWAPAVVLLVGVSPRFGLNRSSFLGMSIVCIIIHIVQSTLRPPECCENSSGTLMIGLPQVHPLNSFRYVRLEGQIAEVDSWHKTAFPVYDV